VGRQGAGEFNQTGGTVNLGNNMEIGVVADSTGTVNLSGGTFSMGQLRVGMEGNGTMTISGNAAVTARTFNNSILIGSGAGNGTLNLDGGTLTTRLVNSGGSGTSIFNFNGGTLVFTSFFADAFEGLTEANILSGGAFIDTNGNGVTIEQNIQGEGGLTKLGSNTLTLSGNNTYTGGTTVNAGTLALSINEAIAEDSDVVIGDGTFSLAGDLGINVGTLKVTGANATINLGTAATISFDGSSSVPWSGSGELNITGNFVAGASIRFGTGSGGLTPAQLAVITVNGTGTYTLNESGFLVEGATPAGYEQWASTNAPTGEPNDDFDGDGVPNAVEFVLGGDKDTNDLGKLPSVVATGTNMTFTFVRDQDSIDPSVSTVIEVGNTLASWPDSYTVGADTGSSSAGVTVTDNEDGTDTVVMTVTKGPDAKKFARLKVAVTP
jgi:autotransporter-associated beta strand protein/T5SS/PEP-CTERM-associated repeat protein